MQGNDVSPSFHTDRGALHGTGTQLTAHSRQAQADARQAAPTELLASPYRSLWDACLSVTPVAKLFRSHRYKLLMHRCPPPLGEGSTPS